MKKKYVAVMFVFLILCAVFLKVEVLDQREDADWEDAESAETDDGYTQDIEEDAYSVSTDGVTDSVSEKGKEDYLLEEFSVSYEAEEVNTVFEELGRKDFLTYSLYDYLYNSGRGDSVSAEVLKDYRETANLVIFTVKVDDGGEDPVYLNGEYRKEEDTFEFQEVTAEPGRTNDYEEIETGDESVEEPEK